MKTVNVGVQVPAWLQRTVLVLRGLPGSGKSTLAGKLPEHRLFSADLVHTREDGVYEFKPENQALAHKTCLKDFTEWTCLAPAGSQLYVVDNTNINEWEYAPYYRVAEAFDFTSVVILVVEDPIICAERNVHGVPAAIVNKMFGFMRPTVALFNHMFVVPNEPLTNIMSRLEVVVNEGRRRMQANSQRR